jgi:uncharacterized membrane protein YfhO
MIGRKLFVFFVLLIPILILIPMIGQFPFPPASPYSDLVITHFPNAVFIRDSLANWKQIPLWSNTILSGYPFAANPLSGLWYLPGWLAIILPIPFGFNFLILLHLLMGGIGMYLFLRGEEMGTFAALAGAVSYELMPKVFAHYAAGHITIIYALCWTPWLLLTEKKRIQIEKPGLFRVLPGIILGMTILADVRWAAYAGILWVCYSFYVYNNHTNHFIWSFKSIKQLGHWFISLFFQVLLSILIALPLILPLLEYIGLSTRNLLTPADVVTSSLPPAKLFGLLIPNFWGYAEEVIYVGELALLILFFIMIIPSLRIKLSFWISAIIVSLLLALGSNIPIIRSFFFLPGINLLRVPSRFLFITGFSFSILLAAGLDYLINLPDKITIPKAVGLLFTALCGLISFLSIGVWIVGGSPSLEFCWGSIFLIIFSGLIILRANKKISTSVFMIVLLPFLVLDLAAIDISEVQYKSVSQVESEKSDAVKYLNTYPGLFRIYSPSYSMPQQIGALHEFQLADGIDPMQMQSYVDFMEKATGVPVSGYSVTLPAFETGNPADDNKKYLPNFHLLSLLNVGFVLSEFPISGLPSNTRVEKIDNSYIYTVTRYPRAWVQHPSSPAGEGIISKPDLIIKPDQIILDKVEGPGLLVLSELYYPGWKVNIDGNEANVKKVFGLFRGVDIPSGTHKVIFSFQPARVYIGLILATLTWFGILLYFGIAKVKKW